MIIRLHSNDIKEIVWNRNDVIYTSDEAGVQYFDFNFNYKAIKAYFREIISENIIIRYGRLSSKVPIKLNFESAPETVEMHFSLSGNRLTAIEGLPGRHKMTGNKHNLFYCKENIRGNMDWYSPNSETFEVNLKPQIFEKYLPESFVFEKFKKDIQSKQTTYFWKDNFPITPQMFWIINQIKHCTLSNHFRKLFIESKVMELLLLQFTQIQSSDKKNTDVSFDLEKMTAVKTIISDRIENPMRLSELAKVIGTNVCSLKKEFKQAFGTTVFGYIQALKMDKAKAMLLEKNLSIHEISETVGYKNPQHFSTAFKKYFGFTPSKIRKLA